MTFSHRPLFSLIALCWLAAPGFSLADQPAQAVPIIAPIAAAPATVAPVVAPATAPAASANPATGNSTTPYPANGAKSTGPGSSGPPSVSDADTNSLRLFLMDGSIITGQLSLKELAVETKFGTLNVPVTSIQSFTPGLNSHPALSKKIAGLLEDLGSGTFNDREAAQQALVKMGPSVRRELERRRDDADAERRTRVRAILTEFEQAQDDVDEVSADKPETDSAPLAQLDSVVTSDFTIVGRIVPDAFGVASLYGPLTVKLADVRRMQRGAVKKEETPTVFSVTGAHVVTSNTLNTNIRLEKGDSVTISASGSIVMTPWGNNASSGPDGSPNYGWYQRNQNQIAVGALIAKVGNGEDYFKVGSHNTFTADKTGVLHLGIAMRPEQAGNEFPGRYAVKVRVARK